MSVYAGASHGDAGPGRPRLRATRIARLVALVERHGTRVARVARLAGLRSRRWIDDALVCGRRRRRRDAGVVAELQAGGVRVGGGAGLARETGRGRSVFDTLEELRRRWDACRVARGDCGVRAVWRLLARRRMHMSPVSKRPVSMVWWSSSGHWAAECSGDTDCPRCSSMLPPGQKAEALPSSSSRAPRMRVLASQL